MAYNLKTIVKLFMVFLFFQISLASIIIAMPYLNTNLSSEDVAYRNFLNTKTSFLDVDTQQLLTDFVTGLSSENLFNDSLLNTFLGLYKIIASAIKFLVNLVLNILNTPNVFVSIFLYNFLGNTAILSALGIIVNIGFYSLLWSIIKAEVFK